MFFFFLVSSGMDSRLRKHFNIEEQDRLIFCETMNADNGSSSMPHWLHTHRPENYDKVCMRATT